MAAHGGMSAERAVEYAAALAKAGRYARDGRLLTGRPDPRRRSYDNVMRVTAVTSRALVLAQDLSLVGALPPLAQRHALAKLPP